MKKLVVVLLFLLVAISDYAQSQNDFYGTAATLTVIFTPKSSLIFNPFIGRFIANPVSRTVFEIFSQEKISNEDANTKRDYPNGFFMGVKTGFVNDTIRLFIHRDKNSLFWADSPTVNIYIKE
jgi:predicted membrane metal-binding protein